MDILTGSREYLKKIIIGSIFVILALMWLFWLPIYASATYFSDISESHAHFQAISYLKDTKILEGYEGGMFKPEDKITRAEALTMMVRSISNKKPQATEKVFNDVDLDAWFAPFVQFGKEHKIVEGYSSGTSFKPFNLVTKAEFLKMLFRTFEARINLKSDLSKVYVDVLKEQWWSPYILLGKNLKLVRAEEDGYFRPEKVLTREEGAEILYRYLLIRKNKWQHFDPSKDWPYFQQSALNFEIKLPNWFSVKKNGREEALFSREENSLMPYFLRVSIDSASLKIYLDEHFALTKNDLQEKLSTYSANFSNSFIREVRVSRELLHGFLLSGTAGAINILDLYVLLPNKNLLIFEGTYGNGLKKEELKEDLFLMEMSFNFIENKEATKQLILSEARKQIMIEGQGKNVLDLFPKELVIIDTDTIGTGSGPVDYYYSNLFQITLKYERSRNIILDMQNGKTTEF